jgi:hypothetical protein
MAVRLAALRAGRPIPPGSFLLLISVRGWADPRAIVRLGGLGNLKKIHLIRTRTRDLSDCSIVPQLTTLRRDNIKMDLKDIEFNCLRQRTADGICGFGNEIFHKIWGMSWAPEWLSVSQDGFCSMEIDTARKLNFWCSRFSLSPSPSLWVR